MCFHVSGAAFNFTESSLKGNFKTFELGKEVPPNQDTQRQSVNNTEHQFII